MSGAVDDNEVCGEEPARFVWQQGVDADGLLTRSEEKAMSW
jgi:hypothetical protein